MRLELLWRRGAHPLVVSGIRRDVRELLPVGAPAALERQRGKVEDEHAPPQIVLGDIDLVVRFVDTYFLSGADHHWRGRWVLRVEPRQLLHLRGLERNRVVPRSVRRQQEARHWRRTALSRHTRRDRRRLVRTAADALGDTGDLTHQLAGPRVVLPDRVLPEIREAAVVHVHAVPLRRVERAEYAPVLT